MLKVIQNFRFFPMALIVTSILAFSSNSYASGVLVKVDENGNRYIENPPLPFGETLTCGNVKAYISVKDLGPQMPQVMALVLETEGSNTQPIRLDKEFRDHIADYHMRTDLEARCLSGNGGIGIIFKSRDASKDSAYIQIDRYGRLFSKFNETGYTLLPKPVRLSKP